MRHLLRNIFFVPFFIITTLLIIFIIFLLSYLPKTEKLLRRLELLWARSVVFASGVRLAKEGVDLGTDTNYIFIANHQSWLDIPVFLTVLAPHTPRFVAKDTLYKIPIFGQGMKWVGHLAINRENNRKGMRDIQEVAEKVKQGESVLIFPEGTRNVGLNHLQPFHIGAFVLALKADRPVVPIIVQGTGRVLPRGSLAVRPARVWVRAGSPVNVAAGYSLKDRGRLRDDVRTVMHEILTEMKQ